MLLGRSNHDPRHDSAAGVGDDAVICPCLSEHQSDDERKHERKREKDWSHRDPLFDEGYRAKMRKSRI